MPNIHVADCDTEVQAGKRFVTTLRCNVCTKFKTRIESRRNFSERWIVGAESVRNRNIRDHARSDQHIHAINLLKQEQAMASNAPTCSYASIAQALSKIPDQEREQLHRKFDIAYFLAKENFRLGSSLACVSWRLVMGFRLEPHIPTKSQGKRFPTT